MIEAFRHDMTTDVAAFAEGLCMLWGADSLDAEAAARVVADTMLCVRRFIGVKD
jgi:hypothetical protein